MKVFLLMAYTDNGTSVIVEAYDTYEKALQAKKEHIPRNNDFYFEVEEWIAE